MTLITTRRDVIVATVGLPITGFPPCPDPDLLIQLTVHRCEQGIAAVRLARTLGVDDWFIQVRLSDMSGFDCVEMLSGLSTTARFFVVAEAYSADEERRAFSWPRTWYVTQPLSATFLRALWSPRAMPPEPPAHDECWQPKKQTPSIPPVLTTPRSFP